MTTLKCEITFRRFEASDIGYCSIYINIVI